MGRVANFLLEPVAQAARGGLQGAANDVLR